MADMIIFTTIILHLSLSSCLSQTSISTPNVACIDDSDCVSLGHKYACYFYQCLNWMDKDTGLQHCTMDGQCGEGMECYRCVSILISRCMEEVLSPYQQ